jgi:hypothetical protein
MDNQENFTFVEELDDTPKEMLEGCQKRYEVVSKKTASAPVMGSAGAETLIVLGRGVRPLLGELTEEVGYIAKKGKLFKTGEGAVVYVSEEPVVENENYLALSLLKALSPKKVVVVDGRLAKEERVCVVARQHPATLPDTASAITGFIAAFSTLANVRGFEIDAMLLEFPGFRPPVRLLMEAQKELWQIAGAEEVNAEVMRKRVETFMPIDLGASLYL